MVRYVLLNVVVMALVAVVILACRLPIKAITNRRGLVIIGALLLLTAVGDNAILSLHLVNYDVSHILGVYLGKAPIEDFSYAIVAAILVPILWEQGAKK